MHPEVMVFDFGARSGAVGEALRVMRSVAEEGRTMRVVTREMGVAPACRIA